MQAAAFSSNGSRELQEQEVIRKKKVQNALFSNNMIRFLWSFLPAFPGLPSDG
jgi:hypothetical protein